MNPPLPSIYLDNNASTQLDPTVLEAMLIDLQAPPHNPSSIHFLGQKGRAHLTNARTIIADSLNRSPSEIFFTSGGTEGLNLLVHTLLAHQKPGQIVTTTLEHPALQEPLKSLHKRSIHRLDYLPVGGDGAPSLEAVERAISPHTCLIALSAANSETGAQIDLEGIAALAHAHQIPLLIDGVGLFGKGPFPIPQGVTAIAYSGHKIHGPKGVGFVFIRRGTAATPLIRGGGQERGLRSGTENLAGILGLAQAVSLLDDRHYTQMGRLRDRLEEGLRTIYPNMQVHGAGARVANVTNLSLHEKLDAQSLLIALDRHRIAVSHGSACASGLAEPSPVLLSMGVPLEQARGSLRFSLSRFTTAQEIETVLEVITKLNWHQSLVLQ